MARINVREKGADGEREIATRLNDIIDGLREIHDLPELPEPQVQRNQNQTAVGGCDLVGTYEFAIEIKRQENLSLEAWWRQAVTSAGRRGRIPVVIFRQNRKPWRVMMPGSIFAVTGNAEIRCRTEVTLADFEILFRAVAAAELGL